MQIFEQGFGKLDRKGRMFPREIFFHGAHHGSFFTMAIV